MLCDYQLKRIPDDLILNIFTQTFIKGEFYDWLSNNVW